MNPNPNHNHNHTPTPTRTRTPTRTPNPTPNPNPTPRQVWSSDAETEQCTCPLRPGGKGGGAPPGWRYNCSTYLPLLRRSLAPWHDGNVTATMLDFAFDHAMV